MFDYKGDEKGELEVIKSLMEQLVEEMKPGAEDFEERLGRKKPGIEVLKIEGKLGDDEGEEENPLLEKAEEKMGMDMDSDQETGEPPMHQSMVMDEDISPQEKLKKRLMKLRRA
jgi:hypothetical protein